MFCVLWVCWMGEHQNVIMWCTFPVMVCQHQKVVVGYISNCPSATKNHALLKQSPTSNFQSIYVFRGDCAILWRNLLHKVVSKLVLGAKSAPFTLLPCGSQSVKMVPLCGTPTVKKVPPLWQPKCQNSIACWQDTSKREGAQSINHLASHKVIQKPPIPPPTPKYGEKRI